MSSQSNDYDSGDLPSFSSPAQLVGEKQLRSLPLPSLTDIDEALQFFRSRRKRRLFLTAIFKMRVNSKFKEEELLEAHLYVTRFVIRVLAVFGKDMDDLEQEEQIGTAQNKEHKPLIFQFLIEVLQEEITKKAEAKAARARQIETGDQESSGDIIIKRGNLLGEKIGKYFTQHHLTNEDDYFASILREGVYTACGIMLLNWSMGFLPNTSEKQKRRNGTTGEVKGENQPAVPPTPSNDEAPLLRELIQAFAEWELKYSQALEVIVPFGWHKGKPLKQVGKRDLRWLIARLPAHDEIEKALRQVKILRGLESENNPEEREEAELAEHLWRHKRARERAVRVRRIDSRIPDITTDRLLLQELDDVGLDRYYDELLELKEQRADFDMIRDAVDIVLYATPASYPSVLLMALPEGDPYRAELEREWYATLRWFRDAFPENRSSKKLEDYTAEELATLEADAVARNAKAGHALDLPRLQPLRWRKTMSPPYYDSVEKKEKRGNYGSFGLLSDKQSGAYVLALTVRGKKLPIKDKQLPADPKNKGKANSAIGENLYFVNYPGTQFAPPPKSEKNLRMFSLEYGEDFHENTFLAPVLSRQRLSQQQPADETLTEDQEAVQLEDTGSEQETSQDSSQVDPEKKKIRRRPRAPLGSLTVVCRWNEKQRQPIFYAHLPVAFPVPACDGHPTQVLGIHEHDHGYSYALLSLSGEVQKVGDLAINPDVLPREGDSAYSQNYPFEVAQAVLRLLERENEPGTYENVYIGLQDTSISRQATLCRTYNRQRFSRPSAKVAKVLEDKVLLSGLMTPRSTSQVSAKRDCCRCGIKLPEDKTGIRRVIYVECPSCHGQQPYHEDKDLVQECRYCTCIWRARDGWMEREFVCPVCEEPIPMIARYNTAIVVAQRTLHQLVEHYMRVDNRQAAQSNDTP